VKGIAKESGSEALSSSLGAVSSINLVHGVLAGSGISEFICEMPGGNLLPGHKLP
jgi:hypothetical protein